MIKHYFATDGSYGDAEGLVIIDTSDWTDDEWGLVEDAPDDQRAAIAASLAAHGSDQLALF
jgi:hypothetical protein